MQVDLPKTRQEALKSGSKFFDTGLPCIHGHLSKRWTTSRSCFICEKSYPKTGYKKYYLKNREAYAQRRKKWRKENPERVRLLTRKHHIPCYSEELYNTNYDLQNGKCAICETFKEKEGISSKNRLCRDHCHKTNKPRGLLCDPCNQGLGNFKEDINQILRAIKYLENDPYNIQYDWHITCRHLKKSYHHKNMIYARNIEQILIKNQNGVCPISLSDITNYKKSSIDHNHNTGYIRGILSKQANCGLASFRDRVDLLQRAINYLRKYNDS